MLARWLVCSLLERWQGLLRRLAQSPTPMITGAPQHFDRLGIEQLRPVLIAFRRGDVTKHK